MKKGNAIIPKKPCNLCGNLIQGDAFYGYKEWGYFSDKDLENHSFCLCESCYDKLMKRFTIPVTITEKTEVLNEKNRSM